MVDNWDAHESRNSDVRSKSRGIRLNGVGNKSWVGNASESANGGKSKIDSYSMGNSGLISCLHVWASMIVDLRGPCQWQFESTTHELRNSDVQSRSVGLNDLAKNHVLVMLLRVQMVANQKLPAVFWAIVGLSHAFMHELQWWWIWEDHVTMDVWEHHTVFFDKL